LSDFQETHLFGALKIEEVMGSHIEDPITFWGQNTELIHELLKTFTALTEICPFAAKVFGDPVPEKIYGGLYSEDQCWYRCKLKKMLNDEKCLMTYIDYGNSETLKKSYIVELPENLQCPGLASKFRLWGLEIPVKQNVTPFDQGRRFLASLINDKIIRVTHRGTDEDGVIFVKAESEDLDIGHEVAEKRFAGKRNVDSVNSISYEGRRENPEPLTFIRNIKGFPDFSSASQRAKHMKDSRNDHPSNKTKGSVDSLEQRGEDPKVGRGNPLACALERKSPTPYNLAQKMNMMKMQHNQRLLEDQNEKLKAENRAHQQNCHLLEEQIKQQQLELKKMKAELEQHREVEVKLKNELNNAVEMKLKCLGTKVEKLKRIRSENAENCFGDDLSAAIQMITVGSLCTPASMRNLESAWNEYTLAQEMLRACKSVDKVESLIVDRNEARCTLYTAVEVFASEVDKLPIIDRVHFLKSLACSLETVYGEWSDEEYTSDKVFDQFSEWRNNKLQEFNTMKNKTDQSLRVMLACFDKTMKFFDLNSETSVYSVAVVECKDTMLDQVDHDVCKELEISTSPQGEADAKIMHSTFSTVMHKIQEEQNLLSVVQDKYAASIEFKEQVGQWLNICPSVVDLLSIKKSVKNLKAQLRWKLVEKSNLEDLDNCDAAKMKDMKEEMHSLRDNIYQEICREREEYERLSTVVRDWFPELPLLHPEAGITTCMQSSGLLCNSLERDLFDPEPMRELSNKRPCVCSEVKAQKVLLKGYSVDVATEAKMIERAAKYHVAWSVLKEGSGIMPILSLFACKSEPMIYIMVPFYPGCSLKAVQAINPLTLMEVAKVMHGVAVGLQTLHNSNIVHASLHPHNVFAVNRERGIIGDFDFTKTAEQRNIVSWMIADTLKLIAPETRGDQSALPAADVFAYGCLLLWLNFPVHSFTVEVDGTPQFSGLNMDCKLESLVSKLIRFNPHDRLRVDEVLKDPYFSATETSDEGTGCVLEEAILASVLTEESESGFRREIEV
uniref:Serine/threonine kinase 31 n=1 Tax=Callorhinchus milii TaxID=7868 RepID=A0A4W3JCT2_CALMI